VGQTWRASTNRKFEPYFKAFGAQVLRVNKNGALALVIADGSRGSQLNK
jgi:hypothetical protein